jgi:general secretion pathway protein G
MGGRSGFTLIEVLIVVIIIAILAAIVIPRVSPTRREAREAELLGQLHEFRCCLALFHAHCGDWPANLADLIATDGTGLVGGGGQPIAPEAYQGPYFVATGGGQLPKDPFTTKPDWVYDPNTGAIHSASTLISRDGTYYSNW